MVLAFQMKMPEFQKIVARRNVLGGGGGVGLFAKSLDDVSRGRVATGIDGRAALDVAKDLRRVGRLNAEGDDPPRLFLDEFHGLPHGRLEAITGANHMVGWHDDHRGVGIVAAHQQRGQTDAGGRVALAGFADDLRGG